MTRKIIIRNPDGSTTQLVETPYDSEDLLQRLLAESHALLPGDQISPESPRRWLLVAREVGIPDTNEGGNRWSVDHLFLDQDGIPTFVEVKRSSDTRLRREVIGQMLDYAANAAVYWPTEYIQQQFEARCDHGGIDPASVIESLAGDENLFWDAVHANLLAGRMRLLFVADVIPAELQRVIEFLNERMTEVEVLGVEIRQYTGGGMQSFIPQVVGRTAEAQAIKSKTQAKKQWDENSFFSAIPDDHQRWVAHRSLEWANNRGLRIWWGKGSKYGSFMPVLDIQNQKHFTFSAWTSGTIEIQFQYMLSRPAFDSENSRKDLLARLNNVPGLDLPDDGIDRRPSIPFKALANNEDIEKFLAIWDWYVDQVIEYYSE